MPRKPRPQAPLVAASISLVESVVQWGDTIHFAVSGDAFDIRVIVVTEGGLSVSFTDAVSGWAVTLGPSPTWPVDGDGNPVGGQATAELEGAPDANAERAILASTTFAVLP